jgi:hypothetical protein
MRGCSIQWLPLLASVVIAAPLSAQADTLGYVAIVHGSWQMDRGTGPVRLLTKGSVVFADAVIVPPRTYSRADQLQIVTIDFAKIVRLCASPGECDSAFRVPRAPGQVSIAHRVRSWFRSTVGRLVSQPERWETLAARSATLREGVLPLRGQQVNWAPVLTGPAPRYLQLTRLRIGSEPQGQERAVIVSVDASLNTRNEPPLVPGLYRVQLRGSPVDSWVLLSSPDHFADDSASFAALVASVKPWGLASGDSLARAVARAGLYGLAGERHP